MEKELTDISIGLVIWQFFLVIAVILIVFYLVKMYTMIKYIKKRLDEE